MRNMRTSNKSCPVARCQTGQKIDAISALKKNFFGTYKSLYSRLGRPSKRILAIYVFQESTVARSRKEYRSTFGECLAFRMFFNMIMTRRNGV